MVVEMVVKIATETDLNRVVAAQEARSKALNLPKVWVGLLNSATSEGAIKLEDPIKDVESVFEVRTGRWNDEYGRHNQETVSIIRSGRAVMVQTLNFSPTGSFIDSWTAKLLLDEPKSLKKLDDLNNEHNLSLKIVGGSSAFREEKVVKIIDLARLTPEEVEEYKIKFDDPDFPVELERLEEWNNEFQQAKQKLASRQRLASKAA